MSDKTYLDSLFNVNDTLKTDTQVTASNFGHSALNITHSIPVLSPYRLLPLMIVSIFFAETFVMFILAKLPELSMTTEALADSSMLLIILAPTFYFFHYRPLQTHHLERKKIVGQLVKSEERLNMALDAVNDGLWDWDFTTDYVYFSPRWSIMLGYDPADIDPHFSSWDELIHPDDRKRVFKALNRHLSGSLEFFESEFRMKTKYQDWRWVMARGKVVTRGDNGEPSRAIGTHTDIHSRKVAEEALQQSEKNIRHLSRQLIDNSESEKQRLAQDLHDEFGQLLTAFQLGIEMILNHLISDKDELEFHCARLMGTVAFMEKELHRICDNLRPTMLDDIGLPATLKWLTKEIEQQSGNISITMTISGFDKRLPNDIELVCYRICQEAIHNTVKHATASSINIDLSWRARTVILKIADDGCGFDQKDLKNPTREHWGIGLLGMHERTAAVNGHVNICSRPGQGTTIELVVPVPGEKTGDEWQISALQ